MKDKEPKIHPLVKAGSLVSALALAACQVGSRASPTTPEATLTGTSSALTVEPPVGFEPSTPTPGSISTLPGAETPTPIESAVAAFRAPTLEELVVPAGEGGPLSEDAQRYYNIMDSAKADIVQKVGVDPSKVKIRYWDNTGSKDDFGWMLYYQIEGGGVIWPLKPDGALADYPAYFDGEGQPDGTVKNLRMNSDYNNWVIAGDKSTAAIFGGTLPVIVDFPKDADVNGETKLVYSRWLRPGGQPADYAKDFSKWQETSGVSEPTPIPMPEGLNSLPAGIIAVRNADGTWGVGIDEGDQTKAIQGILVDAAGFHLAYDGGQVDITVAGIAKRLKAGQSSPLQIYNELETAIVFAYDTENKAWVDAAKVLQPDRNNPENYIKIQTWDDIKELARLEKMVLPPFPTDTYFPPLDKIFRDYDSPNNYGDPNAEFNFLHPFGSLPDNVQPPFRFVNFIVLEKGDGRRYDGFMFTEQVYNPDDGSFSLLHFGPFDNYKDPLIFRTAVLEETESGVFTLPDSALPLNEITLQWASSMSSYLQKEGYMDSSGNMPRIKQLREEWFNSGHVPLELEDIIMIPVPRLY